MCLCVVCVDGEILFMDIYWFFIDVFVNGFVKFLFNIFVRALIRSGEYVKYYFYFVGYWFGVDIYDVLFVVVFILFECNVVFIIELGLYFFFYDFDVFVDFRGIGVCIEDDCVVDVNGVVVVFSVVFFIDFDVVVVFVFFMFFCFV